MNTKLDIRIPVGEIRDLFVPALYSLQRFLVPLAYQEWLMDTRSPRSNLDNHFQPLQGRCLIAVKNVIDVCFTLDIP
ncbi:hypothetical protein MJO28_003438 [Puccinia striiformis f. sp. tritici]|uniref:Uncharacterized protein n=1 Tax=Puccinia striiformis f. sp. tritici TaxID=168172 RepID=A0ACC0EUY6_9BASI|nr:hypothetical protein MJO28_003438 [Puccinia striiformis f. sp. tritici]KAI9613391.1 hypothetical protein H4Q26_009993 [Puccinia striiformis f. sp. tritici PST-130]